MNPRSLEALDTVWEFFAFLLTAVVFLLIGLAISVGELLTALPWIAWGVVAILVGRAIVVYALLGGGSRLVLGRRSRQVLPTAWLHVLFWGGLRGAVAIALALSLPVDFPQRDLLQAMTFGIVLFTLLVQGTTIEWLIDRVGVGRAQVSDAPGSRQDRSSRSPRPISVLAGLQVGEEGGDLTGVRRAVVRVAVVEHQVDLLRLLGGLADPRHPLRELVPRVEVAEALGRRDALLLPGLGVPAVEPDQREVRGRDERRRRARSS